MSEQEVARAGGRFSRRRFLGTLGAGAAGAAGALGGSVLEGRGAGAATAGEQTAASVPGNRFGRMFPKEPPFAADSPQLQAALVEIGRPGGMLDAGDDLGAGPVALIVDPALNRRNRNNTTHTAGTTFVGQFMDHDMTFDAGSPLGRPTAVESSTNARTPTFDLDSVYGSGPAVSPQLYDSADGVRFRLESGGLFEDLPRGEGNTAVIADPRNDENLIISGLQAAFLRVHNNLVARLRAGGSSDPVVIFAEARRLTTWHYQWMIVHEFLPLFVGQRVVDDILGRGRRFYWPTQPFIPVEFQGAAYRFGHSMVRPSYRANMAGDNGGPFFAMVFDPAEVGNPDPSDLSGGCRAPRRFIGWQTFFDFGDGEVKPNKLIDTRLSTPLFNLPPGTIPRPPGADTGPTSLPQRNLLRHITWSLPSGQRLAAKMGLPVLSRPDLRDLAGFDLGLDRSTPLWFYILLEAELVEGGLRLGPVGGRIVGEVIIGLLQCDPGSYLSAAPGWRPTLPSSAGAGEFRMVDFLTFAGVDPASRGQ